jgi:uncharacterized protein (TIGR03435 family)
MTIRKTFTQLLLCGSITLLSGQQTFEVAVIKPNATNDNRVMIRMQPGGRFTASGVTLKQLIGQAYNMRDFQVTGGPGWISADRFDINAKAEGLPDRVPPEQLRPLLKALIEERFKLKSHTDSKEMSIYALVVGKNGHKLTPSKPEGQGPMMRMGRGQLNGNKIPMPMLAQQIAQQLGRTVIDKTELKGDFDITLEWTPEPGHGGGGPGGPPPDAAPPAGGSGPTIFTALQEQLGLRLESQKGPVEILVIDDVSKPTEN